MRVGNREFKPSLPGTAATLVLCAILASLGFWQLDRGDEKRAMMDKFRQGGSTTQILSATNAETLPLFQQVQAYGYYESARQVLLDNMWSSRPTKNGPPVGVRPGVNVLTPLRLDTGYIVLVNRGWLPFGRTRADLPDVAVNDAPRTVRGLIANLPQPGLRLDRDRSPTTSWPRLLNYPTLDELRVIYGEKLLPRIVLLDPQEPDGYEREWAARYNFAEFGPERHIAYAMQWFGLALAVLVIYVVVNLKPLATHS